MTFTQLEDARDELATALRHGVIADDITREHVVKAHRILQQQCRLEHGATIPFAATAEPTSKHIPAERGGVS